MDEPPIRILLVEDDEDDCLLTRRLLGKVPWIRFELDWVSRADAALAALDRRQHDVCLLDYRLGQDTGLDLLGEAVARGCTTPIILLTGQMDRAIDLEAMWRGAVDYLVKGAITAELLERSIRYALERQRVEEALRQAQAELEGRVCERTAELARANEELRRELAERRQAEERIRGLNAQLKQSLERISALRRIDLAITASLDLRHTLDVVLAQVLDQLTVAAAAVLLVNSPGQVLECAAGKGFRTGPMRPARLPLWSSLAGRIALSRRASPIIDLTRALEDFTRADFAADEGFVAYAAIPLIAKGQVRGLMEVFHRTAPEPGTEWWSFFEALAGQAAIALDNASLFEDLQRSNQELTLAYDATIEGWSRVLDLRDRETEGHSRRVTDMTLGLARSLGMGQDQLVHIRRGALLHDIGKLGIPDGILLKPGPLDDDEWQTMRLHPRYAFEWLSPITYLRPALEIPHCHHERWDGMGYPRGLKGEEIPLAARIFAAVDVLDALSHDRPYRKAWPAAQVHSHIRSLAGTHLDERVVDVLLRSPAPDPVAKDNTV
jgi:response regulator RpfG family c-di-GMP phosphodiesterase